MPSKRPAKPAKGKASGKKTAKAKPKKPVAKPPPPKAAPPKPAAPKVAPRPAAAPKTELTPPPAVRDPGFVREASPAERKAALEKVLEATGVQTLAAQHAPAPAQVPAPAPALAPPYVKDSSPEARKAAVEQLVEESGVKSVLTNAPWKRRASEPAPPPAAPPQPAAPQREAPRATMTKAGFEHTTGRSPPKTVVLDSNALMMQFQFHVDIEREVRRILNINFDVVVPSIVVDELQRLAKDGNGKEQAEARMAIELAKTFKIVDSPGDGDTGIMRLAERLNAVVVTNDKRLRAALRAKDIPNIYMRSRAFLTLEGHIQGT